MSGVYSLFNITRTSIITLIVLYDPTFSSQTKKQLQQTLPDISKDKGNLTMKFCQQLIECKVKNISLQR